MGWFTFTPSRFCAADNRSKNFNDMVSSGTCLNFKRKRATRNMKGKKNLNGVTLAERPAAYGLANCQGAYSDSRQTLAAVVRHLKCRTARQ